MPPWFACAPVAEPRSGPRQRLTNALADSLLEDFDGLRWLLTFQKGEPGVASLVAELVAEDAVTRARAAQAIRPLADRAPLELREAVLRAIPHESEPEILARLLWNGYRMLETCRTEALLAIGASRVTNWDSFELAGTAFCVLEGLAPGQLEAVTSLVPRQLDKLDASHPIPDGDHVVLERLGSSRAGSLTAEPAIAVEFRDDIGVTAYALENIRKDAHGRYWLHSWNRQFTDVPVVPDQILPFARFIGKVGESG